jgi:hypothetical protein
MDKPRVNRGIWWPCWLLGSWKKMKVKVSLLFPRVDTRRESTLTMDLLFLFFTLGGLGRDSLSSAKTDGRRDSPPPPHMCIIMQTNNVENETKDSLLSYFLFWRRDFSRFFHFSREDTRQSCLVCHYSSSSSSSCLIVTAKKIHLANEGCTQNTAPLEIVVSPFSVASRTCVQQQQQQCGRTGQHSRHHDMIKSLLICPHWIIIEIRKEEIIGSIQTGSRFIGEWFSD